MKTIASLLITIFLLFFFLFSFLILLEEDLATKYAKSHNLKYVIYDNNFFTYTHPVDTFYLDNGCVKFRDEDNKREFIKGGNFIIERINK